MRTLTVLALSVAFNSAMAADPPSAPRKPPPPETKNDEDTPPTKPNGSVFVIVCDAKPGQLLVLDPTGKWVPNVKEVSVKLEVGKEVTVTCIIYEGVLKPSRPVTKIWTLAQMKSVSVADFQKMVDSLQTDPDAIKTLLKGGD